MKTHLLAATIALSVAAPLLAGAAPDKNPVAPAAPAVQVFELQVTGEGFVPSNIKVKQGQPVRLVVTRKTDRTCATEIVIRDLKINKKLPLNQPVTVDFTPSKSGQLRYACGMDMVSGVIVVE
jgi:plastocyanin domain-containing protein